MIQKININAVQNNSGKYEYRFSQTRPFIMIDFSTGFDSSINENVNRLLNKQIPLKEILNSNLSTNSLILKSDFDITGVVKEQIYIVIYQE